MAARELTGMHYKGVEFDFPAGTSASKMLKKVAKYFEGKPIIIYSWSSELDPYDEDVVLVTVIYSD